MPGPKMGARPPDFNEELVRRAPTFIKWMKLNNGEKLRYACRDFIKGHGDDEERLMRRIMIARRNNLRDHEILKRARVQAGTSDEIEDGNDDAVVDKKDKEEVIPTRKKRRSMTTTGTAAGSTAAASTNNISDQQVQAEMDVTAVELTRSYKKWQTLENGTEFVYNQKYIKGKEGHDWLLKKNIWRRMRYRRENKKMVQKLRGIETTDGTTTSTTSTTTTTTTTVVPAGTTVAPDNVAADGNVLVTAATTDNAVTAADVIDQALLSNVPKTETNIDNTIEATTDTNDAVQQQQVTANDVAAVEGDDDDIVNKAVVEAAVAAAETYVKEQSTAAAAAAAVAATAAATAAAAAAGGGHVVVPDATTAAAVTTAAGGDTQAQVDLDEEVEQANLESIAAMTVPTSVSDAVGTHHHHHHHEMVGTHSVLPTGVGVTDLGVHNPLEAAATNEALDAAAKLAAAAAPTTTTEEEEKTNNSHEIEV